MKPKQIAVAIVLIAAIFIGYKLAYGQIMAIYGKYLEVAKLKKQAVEKKNTFNIKTKTLETTKKSKKNDVLMYDSWKAEFNKYREAKDLEREITNFLRNDIPDNLRISIKKRRISKAKMDTLESYKKGYKVTLNFVSDFASALNWVGAFEGHFPTCRITNYEIKRRRDENSGRNVLEVDMDAELPNRNM